MKESGKITAPASHRQSAVDFSDHSPHFASRESVSSIDDSPRMLIQRRQMEKIQNSPRMLVQQRQTEQISSGPAQASHLKFLVEDDAIPVSGQTGKEGFLAALKLSVRQMADSVLSEIGQSADDCPYIAFWFSYYDGKDAEHIEEAIGRYAPQAMQAADWQQCIALVTAQVREGFQKHVANGSLEGVPDELPVLEPKAKPAEPVADVVQQSAVPIQLCGSDNSKGTQKNKNIKPKEKIRPTKEERARAKGIFRDAKVLNFTDVMHQLVTKIVSTPTRGPVSGEWTGAPKDHLINKWERSAGGEEGMPAYDTKSKESAGTNTAEANQLGQDGEHYFGLEPRYKMQFAMLDYKNDPGYLANRGYGKSYFSITPQKSVSDGFIHFGDSAVALFEKSKGPYKDFEDKLDGDDNAVWALTGKESVTWIEVNLKGGVALPDDVDRFVVNKAELQAAATLKTDNVKLAPEEKYEAAVKALTGMYGDKVEIQ